MFSHSLRGSPAPILRPSAVGKAISRIPAPRDRVSRPRNDSRGWHTRGPARDSHHSHEVAPAGPVSWRPPDRRFPEKNIEHDDRSAQFDQPIDEACMNDARPVFHIIGHVECVRRPLIDPHDRDVRWRFDRSTNSKHRVKTDATFKRRTPW